MITLRQTETSHVIDFDTYNTLCGDCPSHNKCHKGRSINWHKVEECFNEQQAQLSSYKRECID